MRYLMLLAILVVVASQPREGSASQQADDPDQTEKIMEFDKWPGKTGPFKAGFIFKTTDYPLLAGFTIAQDNRGPNENLKGSTGAQRQMVLTSGPKTALITLEVTQTSLPDAHRSLLTKLRSIQALPHAAYKRGHTVHVDVGDVCFVPESTLGSNLSSLREVDFVRNNVRVYVARQGDTVLDVLALAKAIDDQIKGLPGVTRKELEAKLPSISEFEPVAKSVPRNSSIPLKLTVTNPLGQKLEFLFENNIGTGISRDETVTPPKILFLSDFTAGTAMLRATVLTEGLLHATATTAVEVLP